MKTNYAREIALLTLYYFLDEDERKSISTSAFVYLLFTVMVRLSS